MRHFVLILFVAFAYNQPLFAQESGETEQEDLFEMSLEELAEIPIDVASRKESTAREAPGVVTVITRDQIQKSGARDLIDILRLVPGFNVNYDVYGAYGVSIRGLWANEGKVLVLMDGIPLNEEGYGTFQYGHHIPVDVIERIEIMRGPGSAMYGDSAELGVISIKTRQPEKENEFLVSSTYATTERTWNAKDITAYYGTKNEEEDFSLSIITKFGRGNFSDRNAEAIDAWYPLSADLGHNNNSLVVSPFFNVAAKWGNLSTRMIFDRYETTSPWKYDGGPEYRYKSYFYSDIYQIQYEMPITERLKITSQILYKHNRPWDFRKVYNGWNYEEANYSADKWTYDTYLSYDFENGNNIVVGASYDEIDGGDETTSSFIDHHSSTFYYEGLIKTPVGNLTAGGRYVDHSYSGSKHVPRFALTKTFGNWYYKLLYSQAYRSPSILNILMDNGTTLKAETATTYEIEVGAQLNEELSFSVNAFDVEVSDPIIWELYGSYFNEPEMGSRGIEFSADYRKDIYDIGVTYSWYEENDNKVANTTVPNEDDLLLANPAHKVSLYASVNPYKDLFITPTVTYYSPRYSIVSGNDGVNNIYDKLGSSILTNLSILKRNFFDIKGMDVSFSIYNIFNEDYDFIQHCSGWYASGPMPGLSRTFMFTASYRF